jgi:hypothetical protein
LLCASSGGFGDEAGCAELALTPIMLMPIAQAVAWMSRRIVPSSFAIEQ